MPHDDQFPLGLTYDDVLLVPHYSDIPSRKNIKLETQFSRRIKLNIPIVSANMDTVTESRMAIALAREGGIGVIHRFLSLEDQVLEVKKVKRAENTFISDPITVKGEATLRDALRVMREHGITGILVTDEENNLEGILTSRDVRFKENMDLLVKDLMTSREKLVTATKGTSRAEALEILDTHKIEKLPIVDAKGKLIGLMTASDFIKVEKHVRAAKDDFGQLRVAAAIGMKDGLIRAEALVGAGADAIVIDIAHGHHKEAINLVKAMKKKWKNVDVIAGNVATREGTRDLIKAGADGVKVGIGPGAACSTRIVAGAGVPQFTAVRECSDVGQRYKVPVIADGGIKNPGDVAKAVGTGASSVMIGSLFSGALESPGEYYIEDGAAVKLYRGLASRDASFDRQKYEVDPERKERAPEGVSFRVTYKGEVRKIMDGLLDGLQSGMSYSGARNIKEFWDKAEFIQMTEAGAKESAPRGANNF